MCLNTTKKQHIMKKLFLLASLCVAFAVQACTDDDNDKIIGAYIEVTVKNAVGAPLEGRTVYMFKDDKPTVSTPVGDAKKSAITNADGIAVFDLNFTQLNIIERGTNLYFAVFYNIGNDK